MGEQDALGVAGRPGRVEQGDRVLRGDRGQPPGHQLRGRGQPLAAERGELVPGQVRLPRRAGAGVPDDDRAQAGQAGQHGLPPGQLIRPVQDGDPGLAVSGDETHLLGGERGVEGDRDPAGVHGTEVRQHMLGPVRHHERDALPGGQAERDEARRQFERLLPGLGPGQRLAARQGAATGAGRLRERLGQRGMVRELLRGPPELIADGRAPDRFLDLRPRPENLGRHRSPPLVGPAGPLSPNATMSPRRPQDDPGLECQP